MREIEKLAAYAVAHGDASVIALWRGSGDALRALFSSTMPKRPCALVSTSRRGGHEQLRRGDEGVPRRPVAGTELTEICVGNDRAAWHDLERR